MVVERLLNETLMIFDVIHPVDFFCQTLKNHRIYILSSQPPHVIVVRCIHHSPFTQPGMTFLVLGPKANIGCVGVVYLGGGGDSGGWKIGFLMVALSFGLNALSKTIAVTPEIYYR